MTYNHEEILDALRVIKTTCEDFRSCDGCPFDKNDECYLKLDPPDWVLNETNKNWCAFL